MKKPELLSPAGTLKNMRYAFAYGADAVYAGQPRYSLRVRNNSFRNVEALRVGIDEAHPLLREAIDMRRGNLRLLVVAAGVTVPQVVGEDQNDVRTR